MKNYSYKIEWVNKATGYANEVKLESREKLNAHLGLFLQIASLITISHKEGGKWVRKNSYSVNTNF